MKVINLLFCVEATLAATVGSKPELEKRQIAGFLSALAAGDTGILGALGSMSLLEQSTL